jgi:hypothetical protein
MSTEAVTPLKAPFPWFGGKSSVADIVWARFGDVPNYVEPFAGSAAMLLSRPHQPKIETINDADGFVANFWRAVECDPDAVAEHVDWPVNENDLHARHAWLVANCGDLAVRLEGDPDYFDAKVAGWWCWGLCLWIGSGWCSGKGPWTQVDGRLVKGNAGMGVNRKLPHLGNAGMGVNRKLPHLGDAGMGVNRKLPHLGDAGRGQCEEWSGHLRGIMQALSDRLRRVRVCCGDWSRVCGDTPTVKQGLTAVFLDPPYSHSERTGDLYATEMTCVGAVRDWAVEHGDDKRMRICLCGYDGEHELPESWTRLNWKAQGGYGSQGDGNGRDNAERETLWFSPHCLRPDSMNQRRMFDE